MLGKAEPKESYQDEQLHAFSGQKKQNTVTLCHSVLTVFIPAQANERLVNQHGNETGAFLSQFPGSILIS